MRLPKPSKTWRWPTLSSLSPKPEAGENRVAGPGAQQLRPAFPAKM
jgi:hypothetical protein